MFYTAYMHLFEENPLVIYKIDVLFLETESIIGY
jgi:hypothetical protein